MHPTVSILIPSRGERFLTKTVNDLLTNASGAIEIIAVLDGGDWPEDRLPDDPRVHVIRWAESRGMRPAINAAVAMSRGKFLMKCDGHCSFQPGFDVDLAADCADNWVVIPRRDRLDPIAWTLQVTGKPPIDYHYLSNPMYKRHDPASGLHGTPWTQRSIQRADILLDEEMSSQGSCWFMTRAHWDRTIGPLDIARYGSFINEFQEIGLKTWLTDGRVMVNKRTRYLHLHKGRTFGRGYSLRGLGHEKGAEFASWFWMTDQPLANRVHNLKWLIERFWPVPTWPEDIDKAFAQSRVVLVNPYGTMETFGEGTQVTLHGTQKAVPQLSGDDSATLPVKGESDMKIVISRAVYGTDSTENFVDVTAKVNKIQAKAGGQKVPLSFKVTNEALNVGALYPGERKKLYVVYHMGDNVYKSVEVYERKSLRLPVQTAPVPKKKG